MRSCEPAPRVATTRLGSPYGSTHWARKWPDQDFRSNPHAYLPFTPLFPGPTPHPLQRVPKFNSLIVLLINI